MPKDQFGVADPDGFRNFDRRQTRAKSHDALPAPTGEPWSTYMRKTPISKKPTPSDMSSSEVIDTDEGRHIAQRLVTRAHKLMGMSHLGRSLEDLRTYHQVPLQPQDVQFQEYMQEIEGARMYEPVLPPQIPDPRGMGQKVDSKKEEDQLSEGSVFTGPEDFENKFEERYDRSATSDLFPPLQTSGALDLPPLGVEVPISRIVSAPLGGDGTIPPTSNKGKKKNGDCYIPWIWSYSS